MRYLLAVALVLQFSGAPAAWAKPCAMAATRGHHACCLARQGGPVTHFSGSCGCQMTPVPAGQAPASAWTAPETGSDQGVPVADENLAFAAAVTPKPGNHAPSPPGSGRDISLSRLFGSGFRC